ncbi:MAG: hypothetical protein IKU29_00360 [Parabacteroides sp.]|nr:hypothetical protein [Parabacteroides sp.]
MIKNNIEFFILCAMLLILLLVVVFAFFKIMKTNRKRDEELSRLMFSIIRKIQNLDDDYYSLKEQNQQYANDIKRLQEMINSLGVLEQKNSNTITSLTSSIKTALEEYNKRSNEKIYPTPQLSDMIIKTINEFIHQEVTFLRDKRIPIPPNGPVSVEISKRVSKTYPHVDEEWICRKVIEAITEISRNK